MKYFCERIKGFWFITHRVFIDLGIEMDKPHVYRKPYHHISTHNNSRRRCTTCVLHHIWGIYIWLYTQKIFCVDIPFTNTEMRKKTQGGYNLANRDFCHFSWPFPTQNTQKTLEQVACANIFNVTILFCNLEVLRLQK